MGNLLEKLNESQRAAASSSSKYILCLAGAGSGKTSTLTHRVAHLNENRVSCSSMLCLTFTRLAGKEMKERVMKLIGPQEGEKLFCNTFHSFCVKVLKEYGYLIGYDKEFTIYDQEDREDIVKAIIGEFRYKIKSDEVLAIIEDNCNGKFESTPGEALKVVNEYYYRLKRNNAIDLDMLLIKTYELLLIPEVQRNYHNQYEYVFVDEFQDTNNIQMDIVKALDPQNLFVVGDDFQAIYGWRHANIENILKFSERFPECEVIKLEDNYRSTEAIVEASNKLIKHNEHQSEKKLIAHKNGPEITISEQPDENKEIDYIISQIAFGGDKFSDYAILSRTNNQLLKFASVMNEKAIPYEVVSNKDDIFKDSIIKKVIQLIEFTINPKDDVLFKKIINFPEQRKSVLQLAILEDQAVNDSKYMYELDDDAIQEFLKKLKLSLESEADFTAVGTFNNFIKNFDIESIYMQQNLDTKQSKLGVAIDTIQTWEDTQRDLGEDTSIYAFLKWLHLKDIQEKLVEERNAVKLMTVHASKGLEFKNVFVIGMNQDVFPSKRSVDIEEERRLFYVAITRAKDRLFITRARSVKQPWGNKKAVETLPSQFIREMM